MDEMTREELLSAYLDGELSVAEQREVETLLASDAEARSALDELRTLSASLQSLPRLTVGEDLSQRVLRRAERALLERPQVAAAVESEVKPVVSLPARASAAQTADDEAGIGPWRRLAWPLLAVAAAVLIMVVTNAQQAPEVALSPDLDAANEPSALTEADDRDFAIADADGDGLRDASLGVDRSGAAPPSPAGVQGPADVQANVRRLTERRGQEGERRAKESLADKSGAAGADKAERQRQNESAALAARKAATASPAAAKAYESHGRAGEAAANGIALQNRADYRQASAASADWPPQVVVRLNVSQRPQATEEFDRVLQRQNIAFADYDANGADRLADNASQARGQVEKAHAKTEHRDEVAKSAKRQDSPAAADAAAPVPERNPAGDVASAVDGTNSVDALKSVDALDAEPSNAEYLVYVVATPEQVAAALEQLHDQASDFWNVSVEPLDAREQTSSQRGFTSEGGGGRFAQFGAAGGALSEKASAGEEPPGKSKDDVNSSDTKNSGTKDNVPSVGAKSSPSGEPKSAAEIVRNVEALKKSLEAEHPASQFNHWYAENSRRNADRSAARVEADERLELAQEGAVADGREKKQRKDADVLGDAAADQEEAPAPASETTDAQASKRERAEKTFADDLPLDRQQQGYAVRVPQLAQQGEGKSFGLEELNRKEDTLRGTKSGRDGVGAPPDPAVDAPDEKLLAESSPAARSTTRATKPAAGAAPGAALRTENQTKEKSAPAPKQATGEQAAAEETLAENSPAESALPGAPLRGSQSHAREVEAEQTAEFKRQQQLASGELVRVLFVVQAAAPPSATSAEPATPPATTSPAAEAAPSPEQK